MLFQEFQLKKSGEIADLLMKFHTQLLNHFIVKFVETFLVGTNYGIEKFMEDQGDIQWWH